jgi:hypothetical protein
MPLTNHQWNESDKIGIVFSNRTHCFTIKIQQCSPIEHTASPSKYNKVKEEKDNKIHPRPPLAETHAETTPSSSKGTKSAKHL